MHATSDTDRTRFRQAFNRLAVATRLPADQADQAMQRVYFEGLCAFPIEAVEAAARELEQGASWFPKLAEWRDVAERTRNARALLPGPVRDWRVECNVCDDSGFELLDCAGGECGRVTPAGVHAAHTYAIPCVCRAQNATYQRKRAVEREQARTRRKAGERAS